jgi:hypothetical protein
VGQEPVEAVESGYSDPDGPMIIDCKLQRKDILGKIRRFSEFANPKAYPIFTRDRVKQAMWDAVVDRFRSMRSALANKWSTIAAGTSFVG